MGKRTPEWFAPVSMPTSRLKIRRFSVTVVSRKSDKGRLVILARWSDLHYLWNLQVQLDIRSIPFRKTASSSAGFDGFM
jgi:hypothetical protein